MGRRMIEVMQLLVDQIHKAGYQHRALEDDIYAESQKRIAAEKDRDHWRQARQDAMAAGELMQAEIVALRQQLAEARAPVMAKQSEEIAYLRARLDEERSVIASLRQQLAKAQQTLGRERLDAEALRHELERLRVFVGKVRAARDCYEWPQSWNRIEAALSELDAQPATVAEPEGGK